MTRRAVRTPRPLGALPPVRRSSPSWRAPRLARALLTVLLAAACAPSRPAPVPAPEPSPVGAPIPVPEKPVPIDPLAEPWVVGTPVSPVTHELVVTTTVRAAADAAALVSARADSSRTTLTVRWDSAGRASVRSGAVLSFRVGAAAPSGGGVMAVPVGLTLPLSLAAVIDAEGGAVRITEPRESGCGSAAAVAQMVREVLVAPPRRLTRGLTWADSLRTTVCRDSIPLALTSIRHYVVEDARVQEGRAVVVIRRRSSTTLSGTGTQFGEAVTITGAGEGELLFGLRLDDGQMTEGNGVSSLTLTLVGRRKSQVVTQSARLEIRQKAGG